MNVDHKKRAERLQIELQITRNANWKLEEHMKAQQARMESLNAEWIRKINKQKEKNRSLEVQLRKQEQLVKKQVQAMMERKRGVGDMRVMTAWLRADKERAEQSCTRLQHENRRLKGTVAHLELELAR